MFLSNFEVTKRKYPTRFSKYNFKQLEAFISYPKFSVSSRGPQLWNKISEESEKKKTSQTFSFINLESKKNFILLTMS